MKRHARGGFSLVELVIALAVITFVLISLMPLFLVGLQADKVSEEETRASLILTTLESDLRNTHPLANAGLSRIFGLALPYQMDATGTHTVLNTAVALNTLNATSSVGLNDDELPRPFTSGRSRYQATVLYTKVPTPGSQGPIHARLIVSWASLDTTDPTKLTSPKSVTGYVETYVTFPAP